MRYHWATDIKYFRYYFIYFLNKDFFKQGKQLDFKSEINVF